MQVKAAENRGAQQPVKVDKGKLKNVFLDAGGVILDERMYESTVAEIITEIIGSYNPWYTRAHYRADAEDAVHRFVPQVYKYILWKNIAEINRYADALLSLSEMLTSNKPPLILMEGLAETVDLLSKEFRLGILGQYGAELTDLLDSEGMLGSFAFHNSQDEFSITKPDPRYFESVLDKAGVTPDSSIMVGDRIDKDIVPAKMIGMSTIRMRTGLHRNQRPRTPDEEPDFEIGGITGLLEVLYENC
jgi:HAD superfamily hydrolase (TIGR01549 family)